MREHPCRIARAVARSVARCGAITGQLGQLFISACKQTTTRWPVTAATATAMLLRMRKCMHRFCTLDSLDPPAHFSFAPARTAQQGRSQRPTATPACVTSAASYRWPIAAQASLDLAFNDFLGRPPPMRASMRPWTSNSIDGYDALLISCLDTLPAANIYPRAIQRARACWKPHAGRA